MRRGAAGNRRLRGIGETNRAGARGNRERKRAHSTNATFTQRACSGCAGDYEDPERTAASAEDDEEFVEELDPNFDEDLVEERVEQLVEELAEDRVDE
jgi:hypothetical protein